MQGVQNPPHHKITTAIFGENEYKECMITIVALIYLFLEHLIRY